VLEDQPVLSGDAIVPEIVEPPLGDDEDERALRRVIEPLSATMLVKANTNYDHGVTLAELLAYEEARFEAVDLNRDGELSIGELRGPANPGPRERRVLDPATSERPSE
jgi:hypothetical protein